MKSAHLVIEPDSNRPPFFDGGEGDTSAIAKFPCIACNFDIEVPFWDFLEANHSWARDLPNQHVAELAELFKLRTERVMDSTMFVGHSSRFPVVGSCDCETCGHELYVCLSYNELSPLHYEAALDGVAEWSPE